MADRVAKTGAVLVGSWGGDRANLVLADTGGRMTLDCASGTLAGPVHPDAAGHFAAKGSWEKHNAGPQQADAGPASVPASFEGHVAGDTLHLTVTEAGTGAGKKQHFTLVKGRQVKLVRCL